MKNWICAGALALGVVAMAGCKEQASQGDAAKNNPQMGTPSAAGGPAGTVTTEKSGATMQRQTAAGSPGGPTDDLGGRLDAGTDAGR